VPKAPEPVKRNRGKFTGPETRSKKNKVTVEDDETLNIVDGVIVID
jgi:hypothetical protein